MSERRDSAGPVSGEVADREAVIWHELECGGYRADLPLWRELAAASAASARAGAAGAPGAPILDVGAGSGRVTLELARAGHEVTALDLDARLLGALAGRVGSLPVQTVHADARDFQLERRDYALCIAPMQTVQLLGGADGRMAFLRCARTHLRPGGLLACAILTELEPFDSTNGGPAPTPERARVDGMLYVSQALRVQLTRRAVVIERERTVSRGTSTREPERDVIELDRVTATRLRREGREAGLTPIPTRSISATDRHVGSAVVMLSA